MLEKHIERKLVKAVEQVGGMCPKFVSPGLDGVPDRMILLPAGRMAFCEVKAPGARPRKLQLLRRQQL
ncbi:MAG: VRR-NUC domain-containing protein, partial [Eubacteriales bacterium]|nr:VRR-NUC domain-containing protein [Eubacteriales bacterium]